MSWCVALLASVCFGANGASSSEKWADLLSATTNGRVFDCAEDFPADWPSALTEASKHESGEDQILNSKSLALAQLLTDNIRSFVAEIPKKSRQQNFQRVNAVLKLRDLIATRLSYVNTILLDALNRSAYVALASELGGNSEVDADFERALSRLLSFQISASQWISLAAEAFGESSSSVLSLSGDQDVHHFFREYWRALGGGADFDFPTNMIRSGVSDLLQHRDPALLMQRYLQTDIMLRTLALAANYKKSAKDFSLNDDERKIAKIVLSPESLFQYSIIRDGVKKTPVALNKSRLSVGEQVYDIQLSSPHVERFFRLVQTGEISKQVFFEADDFLPSAAK